MATAGDAVSRTCVIMRVLDGAACEVRFVAWERSPRQGLAMPYRVARRSREPRVNSKPKENGVQRIDHTRDARHGRESALPILFVAPRSHRCVHFWHAPGRVAQTQGSVRRSFTGAAVTALAATPASVVPSTPAQAAPVLMSQGNRFRRPARSTTGRAGRCGQRGSWHPLVERLVGCAVAASGHGQLRRTPPDRSAPGGGLRQGLSDRVAHGRREPLIRPRVRHLQLTERTHKQAAEPQPGAAASHHPAPRSRPPKSRAVSASRAPTPTCRRSP